LVPLALGLANSAVKEIGAVSDDNAKRLHDLCEQASQEQDRERMRQLTKEILLLLRESMKKELKSEVLWRCCQ
jgi:hypothetical protein